jgi:Ras-related protein Rab-43
VEFAEAETMCVYIPEILFVLEASAKENTNIDDAFMRLATKLKVGNCC